MKTIGFLGTGNMATAIIKGISQLDVKVFGYDLDAKKLESLAKYNLVPASDLKELCFASDYLFLAVKPQSFPVVLSQIAPFARKDTIFISIAAGISEQNIQNRLGFPAKLIRVMPNTPLLVGKGATALSFGDNISVDDGNFVQSIFDFAGKTAIIPKEKMNEIIAINGSSPAFIYEFARCFLDYGKGVGLDSSICLELFAQTLIGSATMMTTSGMGIDELIEMVSSKGGTTIAGLDSFRKSGLSNAVQSACEDCVKRAYELESEFSE